MYKNKGSQPGTIATDHGISRPLNVKRLLDLELFYFKDNDVQLLKLKNFAKEYQEKDLLLLGQPRLMESKDLS